MLYQRLLDRLLRRLHTGCLRLRWAGRERVYGDSASDLQATLEVRDASFFRDVALGGEIGLGESYAADKWSSDALNDLSLVLQLNVDQFLSLAQGGTLLTFPSGLMEWLAQRRLSARRKTTLENSRRGMSVGYDVGNDFFRVMLGPTMFYSCAFFEHDGQTLEEAQAHKVDVIIAKAAVESGHRVLDIGCGWGTLLGEIHARCGAEIQGISLSREQLAYCCKVHPQGRFDYLDYRELRGEALYDRIVSVGMIEHVGFDQLETFLACIGRLLRPRGRAVLHTMIVGDLLDVAPGRHLHAFATKAIMPVGYVPRSDDLMKAISRSGTLHPVHYERFGQHYGKSTRCWRRNVLEHADEIAKSYSYKHVRAYDYMWAMSSACFTSGNFDLLQLVVEKGPARNEVSVYDPRA